MRQFLPNGYDEPRHCDVCGGDEMVENIGDEIHKKMFAEGLVMESATENKNTVLGMAYNFYDRIFVNDPELYDGTTFDGKFTQEVMKTIEKILIDWPTTRVTHEFLLYELIKSGLDPIVTNEFLHKQVVFDGEKSNAPQLTEIPPYSEGNQDGTTVPNYNSVTDFEPEDTLFGGTNRADVFKKKVKEVKTSGAYLYNGQVIGRVDDFDPRRWFGKVTLDQMPEMAEYGSLDPDAIVEGDDGQRYRKGGKEGFGNNRMTMFAFGQWWDNSSPEDRAEFGDDRDRNLSWHEIDAEDRYNIFDFYQESREQYQKKKFATDDVAKETVIPRSMSFSEFGSWWDSTSSAKDRAEFDDEASIEQDWNFGYRIRTENKYNIYDKYLSRYSNENDDSEIKWRPTKTFMNNLMSGNTSFGPQNPITRRKKENDDWKYIPTDDVDADYARVQKRYPGKSDEDAKDPNADDPFIQMMMGIRSKAKHNKKFADDIGAVFLEGPGDSNEADDDEPIETDNDPTDYTDSKGNQHRWRGDSKTRRLGKKSKEIDQSQVNGYLDALRDSGVTNMFGASSYLEREFGMPHDEAIKMLSEWMRTFSQRYPDESREAIEPGKFFDDSDPRKWYDDDVDFDDFIADDESMDGKKKFGDWLNKKFPTQYEEPKIGMSSEDWVEQARARINANARAIGMSSDLSYEENKQILEDYLDMKTGTKPTRKHSEIARYGSDKMAEISSAIDAIYDAVAQDHGIKNAEKDINDEGVLRDQLRDYGFSTEDIDRYFANEAQERVHHVARSTMNNPLSSSEIGDPCEPGYTSNQVTGQCDPSDFPEEVTDTVDTEPVMYPEAQGLAPQMMELGRQGRPIQITITEGKEPSSEAYDCGCINKTAEAILTLYGKDPRE